MQSPLHHCLLLSHTTGLPFLGHFYVRIQCKETAVEVAGCVAKESPPDEAWKIAQTIQEHLKPVQGASALDMIRACWDAMQTIPRRNFGPQEGKDLSLLMRAKDPKGGAISATGLAEIWTIEDGEARRIADSNTAESSHAGLPEHPPKALPFSEDNALFFGVCLNQKTDAARVIEFAKSMRQEA